MLIDYIATISSLFLFEYLWVNLRYLHYHLVLEDGLPEPFICNAFRGYGIWSFSLGVSESVISPFEYLSEV